MYCLEPSITEPSFSSSLHHCSLSTIQEYLSEMPWLALNYADRTLKSQLSDAFDIGGIPSLIILDENNNVITKDGREAVGVDPDGVEFPWHPKPLEKLTDATVSVSVYLLICESLSFLPLTVSQSAVG